MAVVAFPTALSGLLDRSSTVKNDNMAKLDRLDDGSIRFREIGSTQYETFNCIFRYLDSDDFDTLVTFLRDNRTNYITWTIDGTLYLGGIDKGYTYTMSGNRYNVTFRYVAAEFAV